MTRLLEAANRYLNHGLAPIPLWPDNKKNPHLSSFTEYLTRLPTAQEWQRWARVWPNANIGLITGYWLNYVCLDFDDELTFDTWAEPYHDLSTWIVATRRGFHVWFQTCQEPGKSRIYIKDGLEVLLRAKGGYCIAPPSIHHTGCPYKTVCNVLPLVVNDVSDILTGWKEKRVKEGETTTDRRLHPTPTTVRIEQLIPPIKEHPNARGAYLAKCPFHDDNKPSAWINIQEQRFGCNKCWPDMWWDVINVYAMLRNISNGEAFKLVKIR